MMLRRQHGMLLLSLVGTAALLSLLAGGAVGKEDGGSVVPVAKGDWETVEYPVLDKLIRQRAAEARARMARGGGGAETLAHHAPAAR